VTYVSLTLTYDANLGTMNLTDSLKNLHTGGIGTYGRLLLLYSQVRASLTLALGVGTITLVRFGLSRRIVS
jgi:hypothetical protein